ncbi:MAG TPA: HAD hydrolase family protein [Candidatus Angelobacter sp.]|nr:HAD hydrolase family protein [Candidatus Angelobacter sp.]
MFEKIKAIATDVDGVLTDGTFWWGTNGEEFKRFCFADVTGVAMARKAGLKLALVSGESSEAAKLLVQRFADKLQIPDIYKGCHDKAGAVKEFAGRYGLRLSEVCFIGDDTLDVPAMEIVGVAVAPANAQKIARENATWIASANGGSGVLREVIEMVLEQQKNSK